MADEKTTIRDILVFPVTLLAWILLDLSWRWEGAEYQRKRQKRAKQLEVIERMHQAGFRYEVCHPKKQQCDYQFRKSTSCC